MKQATEYFSRANRPNLPFVIIAMDELDRQLSTMSINNALEPAIRAATGLAKRTLNRYYSLTDQADAYRVSMGASLCPSLVHVVLTFLTSSSSPAQTQILPVCRLVARLGSRGRKAHARGVR